jgi:hypothetical protein
LEVKTDVSGWQGFSGQTDKEKRGNGKGKVWNNDGSIYVGGYKKNQMTEGKRYELQKDRSHTLYHVKYEEGSNQEVEKKLISKGHKIL